MAEWLNSLFESIDRMDPDKFVTFLTEDASFRFGNWPPVCGTASIHDAVAGFFSSIKALRHRVLRIWEPGDTVMCEGEVTYTRHDGRELTLPFANFLEMRTGRIGDYRIYADVSPLYT